MQASSAIAHATRRMLTFLLALLLSTQSTLLTSCGDESSGTLSSDLTLASCKGLPDSDKDGICDALENTIGTNPNNPNSDFPIDNIPDIIDPTPNGPAGLKTEANNGWISLALLSAIPLISKVVALFGTGSESGNQQHKDDDEAPAPAVAPTTVNITLPAEKQMQMVQQDTQLSGVGLDLPNSFVSFTSINHSVEGQAYDTMMTYYLRGSYTALDGSGSFSFEVAAISYTKLGTQLTPGVMPNEPFLGALAGLPTADKAYSGFTIVSKETLVLDNQQTLNLIGAVKNNQTAQLVGKSGVYYYQHGNNAGITVDAKFLGFNYSEDHATLKSFEAKTARLKFFNVANGSSTIPHFTAPYYWNEANCMLVNVPANGQQVNRCAMYSLDESLPQFMRAWGRKQASDLPMGPQVQPWEGIWRRAVQQ